MENRNNNTAAQKDDELLTLSTKAFESVRHILSGRALESSEVVFSNKELNETKEANTRLRTQVNELTEEIRVMKAQSINVKNLEVEIAALKLENNSLKEDKDLITAEKRDLDSKIDKREQALQKALNSITQLSDAILQLQHKEKQYLQVNEKIVQLINSLDQK